MYASKRWHLADLPGGTPVHAALSWDGDSVVELDQWKKAYEGKAVPVELLKKYYPYVQEIK